MRILLVEDEEKVSRFVTLGLNAEQFVVDCAKDGITGYEMSTERPYDVLIIDLMPPRLSGSELISRLRQNRVETPKVGDLQIDLTARQVKRDGKSIRLTTKEYGLLEYLAINQGRVLSRTMIIEHVWDQSFEGSTNIVDVYIRHQCTGSE
jgi:two-component system copper resistance phosphate regulon response regulator CusR